MKTIDDLTQQELKNILYYDKATGIFIWKIDSCRRLKAGDKAGSIDSWGYTRISIRYRRYRASRLAWLYVTGEWPKWQIDHRDGNRSNNIFENLRDISNRGNGQNKQMHRDGKLAGCSFEKARNKWTARYWHKGKVIFIGRFFTEEEAHQAYLTAIQSL